MTESEWLVSDNPINMLNYLSTTLINPDPKPMPSKTVISTKNWKGLITDRKIRLLACACARQVWNELTDPRIRKAVEVGEEIADGLVLSIATDRIQDQAYRAFQHDQSFPNELAMLCMTGIPRLLANTGLLRWFSVSTKLANQQADLIREIFGNKTLCGMKRKPFHNQYAHVADNDSFWIESECPLCNSIKTPTVVAIAKATYEKQIETFIVCNRCEGYNIEKLLHCPECNNKGKVPVCNGILDSNSLAILADAAEDAGCENPDVLNHLRGNSIHVRGCHILDLFLGKE